MGRQMQSEKRGKAAEEVVQVELTGQVIALTGGTSGIGRAAVEHLRSVGAEVALIARDSGKAERVAGETGAVSFIADICNESAVGRAFDGIFERWGRLDGVVANAGLNIPEGLVHRLSTDVWEQVMATDLRGTFLTVREALSRMVPSGQGGSIVCVSSVMAHGGIPGGGTAYTAAKGGVESFVRSVAVDYAPYGIRCNAIAPGATETEMMWVTVPPEDIEPTREILKREIPLGRLGEPIDIARAIAWLVSSESAYVTGTTLMVDGGVRARLILSV
jgi:NAD(P)-dependent dehydrogenase (short-subunit alcohol dehydrogenase family)